ncbi:hypothetical protein [Martelella soudanensis]|uniref:hypothetical protein n=1 Tax=unclassified Martelella TaxID=2629616 RepID=UPI0015DFD61D|nr:MULTISPECIES: hypothetical protein [unclassified Martelella]
MTIAPSAGALRITCNACAITDHALAEPLPANASNHDHRLARQRLAAAARRAGWIIRKTAGQWQHHCPACARRRAGDITRQDRLL